jgi:caa(3)-type oxidase subunit IV
MADSSEEIKKSVRKILWIGGILAVCTVLTVWLSTVELATHGQNIVVGMILATIKAGLVGLVFMHLNHEAKLIYKVLAFTVVFVTALFLLFYWSSLDPLVFRDF